MVRMAGGLAVPGTRHRLPMQTTSLPHTQCGSKLCSLSVASSSYSSFSIDAQSLVCCHSSPTPLSRQKLLLLLPKFSNPTPHMRQTPQPHTLPRPPSAHPIPHTPRGANPNLTPTPSPGRPPRARPLRPQDRAHRGRDPDPHGLHPQEGWSPRSPPVSVAPPLARACKRSRPVRSLRVLPSSLETPESLESRGGVSMRGGARSEGGPWLVLFSHRLPAFHTTPSHPGLRGALLSVSSASHLEVGVGSGGVTCSAPALGSRWEGGLFSRARRQCESSLACPSLLYNKATLAAHSLGVCVRETLARECVHYGAKKRDHGCSLRVPPCVSPRDATGASNNALRIEEKGHGLLTCTPWV